MTKQYFIVNEKYFRNAPEMYLGTVEQIDREIARMNAHQIDSIEYSYKVAQAEDMQNEMADFFGLSIDDPNLQDSSLVDMYCDIFCDYDLDCESFSDINL